MFNRNRHLSLTDARIRLRKILSSSGVTVLPADVTTTCVPVGSVPVRVIPPIRPTSPPNAQVPVGVFTQQPEEPTPALLDTREKIVSDLCSLILRAEFLPDPDLAIALFSCLRLVTEGKSTLARASQNQGEDNLNGVEFDNNTEWRM